MRKNGFSLVELTVVLVIVGLIAGGIFFGADMLADSKLRIILTDRERYISATRNFKDQYNALPGDMPNATRFWPALDDNPANCRVTGITGNATCDGNGDGIILTADNWVTASELWHYWAHLKNAGFIDGTYTGLRYSSPVTSGRSGFNLPKVIYNNAGYSMYGVGSFDGGDVNNYEGELGNALVFGTNTNLLTSGPALNPKEAIYIDRKVDDGKPGTGIIVSYKPAYSPNCASSNDLATAIYMVDQNIIACSLIMATGF